MGQFELILILIFAGQIVGATVGLIGKPRNSILFGSLAFAGAMMISLSLFELIPSALEITSKPVTMLSFFAGIVIMLAVDKALPHVNPELMQSENPSVKKSIFMLTIGMALHNIPEGLAIGAGFKLDPSSGILIATGIALQDIPENIATIIPLFAFTKSRLKAFLITTSTVLFEFLGFLIGYFSLKNVDGVLLGMSLASAAGFMAYLSIEELIPTSFSGDKKGSAYIGFVVGTLTVLLLLVFA
jgi:ZIP family zinc transporter